MIDPMQLQGQMQGVGPGVTLPMSSQDDPAAQALPTSPDLAQDPTAELVAEPLPPIEPVDPALAALDALMDLPGPDAIRRVYELAASAAKAKVRIAASADRLDARTYHDLLSRTPEARYAAELIAARRRLDTLAQERRRLNLELTQGAGKLSQQRYQLLEVQVAACTAGMEQVAGGVLLFLTLPDPAILAAPVEPPVLPEPEVELQ